MSDQTIPEVEGVPGHSDTELAAALKEREEATVEPPARPDVTPIQWTVLIGVVIQLTRAFGIWDPSQDQEEALNVATGAVVGLGFGDAVLRGFRNLAAR